MTDLQKITALSVSQKQELLAFLDYLHSNDKTSFVAYVNERTRQAVNAKERGDHFFSLAELQADYEHAISSLL